MYDIDVLEEKIESKECDTVFNKLYSEDNTSRNRYLNLINRMKNEYPDVRKVKFFSTPGRTEIGGNHTDHNCGHILAASVDLDTVSCVGLRNGTISISSEGYDPFTIDLNNLDKKESEIGTSIALAKGVCARFLQLGYKIGGFCTVMDSNVQKGSGLSSSAAFEVQIANILNVLYNEGEIDPVTMAQVAQYSENEYFGKPCGLMDQSVCSVGNLIMIDFDDLDKPVINQIDLDFTKTGYTLVISDTGGNHADMTDDYTALENEMKSVAKVFGHPVLRRCTKEQIMRNIPLIRSKVSDRALLRAIHFFDDDKRVLEMVDAIKQNDFDRFLKQITESGRSSWELCQNCYSHKYIESQGISVGLEISRYILKDRGAFRVHGGGFAGTIQAFVPNDLLDKYIEMITNVFGEKSVFHTSIRTEGTIEVIF